jgi:hypothetical protein
MEKIVNTMLKHISPNKDAPLASLNKEQFIQWLDQNHQLRLIVQETVKPSIWGGASFDLGDKRSIQQH